MKTISSPTLTIRASTIGQLIQADDMTQLQKRLGLAALIDLVEDTVTIKVKHGIAAETAAILKEGGLPAARAKYYSEKAAQVCAALQLQGVLASSKACGIDAKAEAYNASMSSNLAMLASMASVAAAQAWAKKNGPKARAEAQMDEASEKLASVPDATDTPDDNQPSAQAIEAAGMLREVREVIAMVMSGQLSDKDAVSAIAEVLGMIRGATLADIAHAKGKASAKVAA